jgi:hypothetical protein
VAVERDSERGGGKKIKKKKRKESIKLNFE